MSPELISLKLKTFAHSEFSNSRFSDVNVIKDKIENKIDLFERGHNYKKVDLDRSFPRYLIENRKNIKLYIINGEVAEWLKAHAWKACKG